MNGVFAYGLTRKAPPMELYFAVVARSNENFHVTGTVHFNDGSTCKFEKSVINGIEGSSSKPRFNFGSQELLNVAQDK